MSLKRYAALLPGSYHYLSACCFTIFNQPKAVASIFKEALVKANDKQLIANQFREALLRAGIFGGMSKAINSLHELNEVMPDDLRQQSGSSPHAYDGHSLKDRGTSFLQEVYGDSQAAEIESSLYKFSPRLGLYSISLVYGGIYSDKQALSTREACVLMYLCNMAVDTPKQAQDHVISSKRHGATTEELLDVGMMVQSIASLYRVELRSWGEVMNFVETGER